MAGRGTIRERRPNVWEVRAYVGLDADGKPVQVSRTVHGGRREAQSVLARLVTEVADHKVGRPSKQTFGEYLDDWLAHVTTVHSPTTIRGYRSHVKAIKDLKVSTSTTPLGSKRLTSLKTEDLDKAYQCWLNSGRSMATVRHRHNIIGAALQQAVRWGRVPRDVSDLASPPPLRTRKVPRVRPETVQALIRAAEAENSTLAAAIALAAVLGARRGELCGLRWTDLDTERGRLLIERAAKHGLDPKAVVLGDVKNHQPRDIALDAFALGVLSAHRRNAEKLAADAGVELRPDGFILTPVAKSPDFDPTGGTAVKPDYITQAHRKLAHKLGLPVRFHDLRHFAATEMIGARVDPRTAAARLGHDPVVLMRIYASAVEENDREAANVLGRLLTAAT